MPESKKIQLKLIYLFQKNQVCALIWNIRMQCPSEAYQFIWHYKENQKFFALISLVLLGIFKISLSDHQELI